MTIKMIDTHYYVSGQITDADLEDIKKKGIRSIICNRPDGEAPDQPNYNKIAHKAQEIGFICRFIPIDKGMITSTHIHDFTTAFSELPKPILGYCRSGMRSTSIWSLANIANISPYDIIQKAANAGYDIAPLISNTIKHD